jgi:hypothetical protein
VQRDRPGGAAHQVGVHHHLKTAKLLGIEFSPALLALADEVVK